MNYVGVDPGAHGAIVALQNGSVEVLELHKSTPRDWSDFLLRLGSDSFAFLERVSAMPGQGVASTFKFGHNAGMLEGLLIAQKVPFERITPVAWQTAMKCRSKGNKNVTKARAQELFPLVRVTHAVADALLLAELARREATK